MITLESIGPFEESRLGRIIPVSVADIVDSAVVKLNLNDNRFNLCNFAQLTADGISRLL